MHAATLTEFFQEVTMIICVMVRRNLGTVNLWGVYNNPVLAFVFIIKHLFLEYVYVKSFYTLFNTPNEQDVFS